MLTFRDKQKTLFKRLEQRRSNRTESELYIESLLSKLPYKFIPEKGFIQGDYYCFVDFYLPKPMKVCLEVDGGYHNTPEQKARDRRKDSYLESRGFRVIRITNEEALSLNTKSLAELITTSLC